MPDAGWGGADEVRGPRAEIGGRSFVETLWKTGRCQVAGARGGCSMLDALGAGWGTRPTGLDQIKPVGIGVN